VTTATDARQDYELPTPPDDVAQRDVGQPYVCAFLAALAVTCPRCKARPGSPCQSTGGGNPAEVVTHRARERRVEGFTEAQTKTAQALIKQARSASYQGYRVDLSAKFAVFESVAAPVKADKPVTPKGVRLSELQAEEIEGFAYRGGKGTASTAHFHGDHQHRQTINALVAKGILAECSYVNHGYSREYTLTGFGWQVYLNHRLIFRNSEGDRWAALLASQNGSEAAS
jgi:hypothetical protein